MNNPQTVQVAEKQKEDKLLVAFVLDESGSMNEIQSEAISFLNEQIQTIKEESKNTPTKVSLVTFSYKVNKNFFWNENIDNVNELTPEEYNPNGGTAMYDAVGYAITRLLEEEDAKEDNTAVLVVVISDGMENCSKDYNASKIASLVSEVEKTNRWTFTYFGANQDLSKLREDLNIKAGNTYLFKANSAGMQDISTRSKMGISALYNNVQNKIYSVNDFCETYTTKNNNKK